MTASTKTASATAISRALNAKGFSKSSSGATRVRGYHYTSEGFVVTNYPKSVIVTYEPGSSSHFSRNYELVIERQVSATNAMFSYLVEKGYKATMTDRGVILIAKVGA
tara:strand:- start:2041 stop:2364 length:324 start_codon:yes stop_codon:yes gene_type:complete